MRLGAFNMKSRRKAVPEIFKWRHFIPEIILLCVRWYLSYRLSYRDLVEMMAERGLKIAHTTILRWVFKFSFEHGVFIAIGFIFFNMIF